MGNIKKIGNEFVIEFYARGLKYQQKAGRDKKKAETLLNEIETKIRKGEAALIVRNVDADIFFHDFLENAKENYPAKTFARYKSAVEHFHQFLTLESVDVVKLSEVTPAVLEHYKAHLLKKKIKPKLLIFTLFLLHGVLEYAIKLGYLNDNPSIHIKAPSAVFLKPRVLNDAQTDKLLNGLSEAMKDSSAVPFDQLARGIIPNKKISLPTLRHTFAISLAKKKVPLTTIQKILGINDVAKLLIYTPFIPREI